MPNPYLTELSQVGIIVRDLRTAMEYYWKELGVGPWKIFKFAPPELTETTVRGIKKPFGMKVGLATSKSWMIELIEPLEGRSIYNEFLESRGPGQHHMAYYLHENIERAEEYFQKRGIAVLQSGRFSRASFRSYFAYLDTEKELGTVIELLKRWGELPQPDETYPSASSPPLA